MMIVNKKEYFLTPLIKLLPSIIYIKETMKSKLQQNDSKTSYPSLEIEETETSHQGIMVQIGKKKNTIVQQ